MTNPYVTWLILMWHDTFVCVTWLIHMCDMTHSYGWRGSFICVPWRIHTRDMTHSYVCHDAFIRVTWLIHMTQSYPQTEEIRLRIITTAKMSTNFRGSPHNFQTSCHGRPQKSNEVFTKIKRESSDLREVLWLYGYLDLQIIWRQCTQALPLQQLSIGSENQIIWRST